MHPFNWLGNNFILSEHRVLFWQEKQTIIASDLHLGKSGHFRKSGIAVPQEIMKQDLMCLFQLFQHFNANRIVVVGDMFHSHANKEMEWFARWRKDLPHIQWILVRGNHDVLQPTWYHENDIEIVEFLIENNLLFTHEPAPPNLHHNVAGMVSGHIHPGINLKGVGRQSISMPCFYFSAEQCILPAFGVFTGMHIIKPKKKDQVFAIANKKIIPIS